MEFWRRLFGSARNAEASEEDDVDKDDPKDDGTIRLPQEPFVFECKDCGKIFEVRRRKATCPECDSENVEIVSE